MKERTVEELPSLCVQIESCVHPGDHNCGPHIALYALCRNGTIWVKYHASPNNNVPTDGLWRKV